MTVCPCAAHALLRVAWDPSCTVQGAGKPPSSERLPHKDQGSRLCFWGDVVSPRKPTTGELAARGWARLKLCVSLQL